MHAIPMSSPPRREATASRPAPAAARPRGCFALALAALAAVAAFFGTPALAEQIVSARYAEPVERYGHHALGRPHEYARVIATTDSGREAVLKLPREEVFEDLAPRLVRLSAEAPTQLLVIVSARSSGSRLALLGLAGGVLETAAQSAPIGTPQRWLNPVGVADLDADGEAEIAAVTTPHIGGMLRIYRREGRTLAEVAALPGFSNHVYGSADLGLSAPAWIGGRMQLLVPDVQRTRVRAVALIDGRLQETGHCPLAAPIASPAPLRDCASRLNGAIPAPAR